MKPVIVFYPAPGPRNKVVSDSRLILNFANNDGSDTSAFGGTYTQSGGGPSFSGNAAVFDGTDDMLVSDQTAADYVFLHNSQPWTAEFVIEGLPAADAEFLMVTNNGSSAQRGVFITVSSTGAVRIFLTDGVAGQPIMDYTTATGVLSGTGEEHVVVEVNYGRGNTSDNHVWIGTNGTRRAAQPFTKANFASEDPPSVLRIGGYVADPLNRFYSGTVHGVRVMRGIAYNLKGNATYTQPSPPFTDQIGYEFSTFTAREALEDQRAADDGANVTRYNSFPMIERGIGTGDATMAFWASSAHPGFGSDFTRALLHRTEDFGRNWGPIVQVVDSPASTNDETILDSMSKTATGRLIMFYRTLTTIGLAETLFCIYSDDDGATWSSPYDVSARTSAGFQTAASGACRSHGKVVKTSNGLAFAVYGASAGEVEILFSSDDGATWGSPVTLATGMTTTIPTETWLVRCNNDNNIVAVARLNGTGKEETYHFWKSANGGSTWSDLGEQLWNAGTLQFSCPPCIKEISAGRILTLTAERGADHYCRYVVSDAAEFFTNPKRAFDGTDAATVYHQMGRVFIGGTASTQEMGYPDFVEFWDNEILAVHYEPKNASSTTTRVMTVPFRI